MMQVRPPSLRFGRRGEANHFKDLLAIRTESPLDDDLSVAACVERGEVERLGKPFISLALTSDRACEIALQGVGEGRARLSGTPARSILHT